MPARRFPEGFIWGTATAAHQVDGGNWNNDWWAWEHDPESPCREPSADACDHWHRYPEDIGLLADLGFNAYRFSLEWSRIEPEEGEFSLVALDHYRRMAACCRERGLEPIVTFHHFTTPRWAAARGGWTEPQTADRFAVFCARAAGHLGDTMGRACTLNEPNIVALMGYRVGVFPPGARDVELRHRANEVFVDAHRKAVAAIRGAAPVPVGLTLSMADWQAVDGGEAKRDQERRDMEDVFLEATEGDDFIGVQTYTRFRVGPEGMRAPAAGTRLAPQMGYEFAPEALEATIRRAWEVTRLPVLVTEHGIGTADDAERIEFVGRGLPGVLACLADGIDVRGYVYWSLLDNFEWVLGYGPTFGLVAVDRETQARRAKPSAKWLGAIARANALPEG
jgi:beta-glucosidase